MISDTLQTSFLKAQDYVRQPKLKRWTRRPLRHAAGLVWTYLCYPVLHRPLSLRATLFTGDRITVPLPAGLDLYLTDVKSHISELRLTRYILATLKKGDVAIDAGAHLGYFTLVMAACVSEEDAVVAFEPSGLIGKYLRKNVHHQRAVRTEQIMLSATKGESTFHEFPLRYSEFNTSIQRVSEKITPSRSTVVPTTSLDAYCKEHTITPTFIKIDVEGGEYNILKGAVHVLESVKSVAIELRKSDYTILYAPAVALLVQFGFSPFRIEDDGSLESLADAGEYIAGLSEESDNVVFKKMMQE